MRGTTYGYGAHQARSWSLYIPAYRQSIGAVAAQGRSYRDARPELRQVVANAPRDMAAMVKTDDEEKEKAMPRNASVRHDTFSCVRFRCA